jgi:hypothetical protein
MFETETEENQPVVEQQGPESVEETVRRSILEVGDEPSEKEAEVHGDESSQATEEEAKEPESEATKAGRTLAALKNAAKQGQKRRRVVEAAQLEPKPDPKPAPKEVSASKTESVKLEPPTRFPVTMKEKFLGYPRELQEQVTKDWGEIEGQWTKLQQDTHREKQRYAEVNQVIDHYLPRWNVNNITPAQAVMQLCAAQDLINQDPVKGIQLLMQKTGVTVQHLGGQAGQQQNQPPPQTFTNQTQNPPLTRDELLRILQEERQQAQTSSQLQADNAAAEGIRNKRGQNGQYLYPELWDSNNVAGNYWNAAFVNRVKPLVVASRETHPSLSMAERIENAIRAVRVMDGHTNGSLSPGAQRLPGGNPNQVQEIKRASLSVKQRGAPNIPVVANGKPGEKMEETVRRSIAQVMSVRGR